MTLCDAASCSQVDTRFRRILRGTPAALFQAMQLADGSLVLDYISPCFAHWHGLDIYRERHPLTDVLAVVHPDDRAAVQASVMAALGAQQSWAATYRVQGDDVQPRWIQANATVHKTAEQVVWSGQCVDVTALMVLQADLEASEHKFRDMFETAITGHWVHRNFRPLIANSALAHMLGYAGPDELLALADIRSILTPEMIASTEDAWMGLLAHRAQFFRRRLRLQTRAGRDVWVEVISKLVDWDGQPAMQDTLVNVTAEVSYAHDLQNAHAEAEAALLAKSQFLAAISHEVRTPMNGIIAMADVLAMSQLSDDQRDCLTLLQESGRQMMRLVDNILDFDRLDAGRLILSPQPVDLEALLNDLITAWRPRARARGLRLLSELSLQADHTLMIDPVRLTQVLEHLLSNAIKFTDAGVVQLNAYTAHEDDRRSTLRIEVTDPGVGLPENLDTEQLFEGFVQPDRSIRRHHDGLGLGLAICRKIIALMDGRIGAIRHPDAGTTFWIECSVSRVSALPLAGRAAA